MLLLCNADGRYGDRDRRGVRENGRGAGRDRDAPTRAAEANGGNEDKALVRIRIFSLLGKAFDAQMPYTYVILTGCL